MNFGKYFIGQNFSEISNDLTEISKEEYIILPPILANEKIYHAKDSVYCEVLWNSVLGVADGRVYKISLQTIQIYDPFDISGKQLWKKVYDKLNNEFSTFPDREKFENSSITSWNTIWGNIILNQVTIPKEKKSSEIGQTVFNIAATGNFAFKVKLYN